MLTGASAVGLVFLAEPVARLVFEHGRTSAADAAAIASCLQAYVVGLVPYSLVKILAPAYYSVGKPAVPLAASVSGVVVNLTFNALTYRALRAQGIALGTALGAMVNVAVLRSAFGPRVAPIPTEGRGARFGALGLGLLMLGALSYAGRWVLDRLITTQGPLWLTKLDLGVGVVLTVGVAGVSYALLLRALGYPGGQMLLAIPSRLWQRLRR